MVDKSQMVLIPREPTEAMYAAANDVAPKAWQEQFDNLADVWAAMIAAAPPQVQAEAPGMAAKRTAKNRWRWGYSDGIPGTPEYEPAPRICNWCNNIQSRCLCETQTVTPEPPVIAAGEREEALREALTDEAVEAAAKYVLDNSRRGKASLNDEQFAADTDALMTAYRDIIRKAWASGALNIHAMQDQGNG